MKIGIVTNYVVGCDDPNSKSVDHYHTQAERFVASYREFKPYYPDLKFILIAAGGELPQRAKDLYGDLPTSIVKYDGGGWWEGELQCAAAAHQDLDLMVNFICAIHFRGHGWLDRFLAAREKFGDGLFGAMGSYELNPHLRSCALACSPQLILGYLHPVNNLAFAHLFEHGGEESFTGQTIKAGKPAIQVTWDGFYEPDKWRDAPNVFRKGDQSNLLVWDHHADNYMSMDEKRRIQDANLSDGKHPFIHLM
jgi:hypothetical protein